MVEPALCMPDGHQGGFPVGGVGAIDARTGYLARSGRL